MQITIPLCQKIGIKDATWIYVSSGRAGNQLALLHSLNMRRNSFSILREPESGIGAAKYVPRVERRSNTWNAPFSGHKSRNELLKVKRGLLKRLSAILGNNSKRECSEFVALPELNNVIVTCSESGSATRPNVE